MKFKFVKTLEHVEPGQNIVIDGFTYYAESVHPTKRSAIVACEGFRLQLIVQASEPIEEKLG